MKMKTFITTAPACLTAVGLLTLAAAIPARAAAPPALQGQVIARPAIWETRLFMDFPRTLKSRVGCHGRCWHAGLPGSELNIAIQAADITGVSWVLTNQPIGSAAVLQTRRLGTNVTVYDPADRLAFQVASLFCCIRT